MQCHSGVLGVLTLGHFRPAAKPCVGRTLVVARGEAVPAAARSAPPRSHSHSLSRPRRLRAAAAVSAGRAVCVGRVQRFGVAVASLRNRRIAALRVAVANAARPARRCAPAVGHCRLLGVLAPGRFRPASPGCVLHACRAGTRSTHTGPLPSGLAGLRAAGMPRVLRCNAGALQQLRVASGCAAVAVANRLCVANGCASQRLRAACDFVRLWICAGRGVNGMAAAFGSGKRHGLSRHAPRCLRRLARRCARLDGLRSATPHA